MGTDCEERMVMVLPQPHQSCCVEPRARHGTAPEPMRTRMGSLSGMSQDMFCSKNRKRDHWGTQ